jgi:hypothetical protein
MNYAYAAWDLAADTYLLKLRRLKNKILDLHTVINLPYVYDFIRKLYG